MGVIICPLVRGSMVNVGDAPVVVAEAVGVQKERECTTCEALILAIDRTWLAAI